MEIAGGGDDATLDGIKDLLDCINGKKAKTERVITGEVKL